MTHHNMATNELVLDALSMDFLSGLLDAHTDEGLDSRHVEVCIPVRASATLYHAEARRTFAVQAMARLNETMVVGEKRAAHCREAGLYLLVELPAFVGWALSGGQGLLVGRVAVQGLSQQGRIPCGPDTFLVEGKHLTAQAFSLLGNDDTAHLDAERALEETRAVYDAGFGQSFLDRDNELN